MEGVVQEVDVVDREDGEDVVVAVGGVGGVDGVCEGWEYEREIKCVLWETWRGWKCGKEVFGLGPEAQGRGTPLFQSPKIDAC